MRHHSAISLLSLMMDDTPSESVADSEEDTTLTVAKPYVVMAFDLDSTGKLDMANKSVLDLLNIQNDTQLPVRDLRVFFQQHSKSEAVKKASTPETNPAVIINRPSTDCVLISLEYIKVITTSKKAYIFNVEEPAVMDFAMTLQDHVKAKLVGNLNYKSRAKDKAKAHGHDNSFTEKFLGALAEHVAPNFKVDVLDCSLSMVVGSFSKKLNLMLPLVEELLASGSGKPDASLVRKLMAIKKNMLLFVAKVKNVKDAVNGLYDKDTTFFGMARGDSYDLEAEGVDLMIGAYFSDLKTIENKIKLTVEQIDNTNDFFNLHLGTIRNSTISVSLYFEYGGICVAVANAVYTLFGMNIPSGWADSYVAFVIVSGGCLILGAIAFFYFGWRYKRINENNETAVDYERVRNYFNFVDKNETSMDSVFESHSKRAEFYRLLEGLSAAKPGTMANAALKQGIVTHDNQSNANQMVHRKPRVAVNSEHIHSCKRIQREAVTTNTTSAPADNPTRLEQVAPLGPPFKARPSAPVDNNPGDHFFPPPPA